MGLEGNERLGQTNEKEGGIVEAITKPVDDRINDPKSESKNKNNLQFFNVPFWELFHEFRAHFSSLITLDPFLKNQTYCLVF